MKNVNARVYVKHSVSPRAYLIHSLANKNNWYKPTELNDENIATTFEHMNVSSVPVPNAATLSTYDFLGHYYIAQLPDMN